MCPEERPGLGSGSAPVKLDTANMYISGGLVDYHEACCSELRHLPPCRSSVQDQFCLRSFRVSFRVLNDLFI